MRRFENVANQQAQIGDGGDTGENDNDNYYNQGMNFETMISDLNFFLLSIFILLNRNPYVYTEQIFESQPFMYNKIFLKSSYRTTSFTLLLAPFAPKLVNYSSQSDSLKNV